MLLFDKIKTIMAFDVKITTIFRPLDLIAPFSCRSCGALGEIICGRCKKYNITAIPKICPRCENNRDNCKCEVPVYVVSKREGILADLTEDYKYKSIRAAAEVLAEFLDEGIRVGEQYYSSREKFEAMGNGVIVVPLPTISKHIRERGFDHTLLIAKKLAKRRKGWKVQNLLARAEQNTQVGADGEKRRRQAKSAYKLKKTATIDQRKTYLLLDDVWTTGASMEAAIAKLKAAGADKLAAAVVLIP